MTTNQNSTQFLYKRILKTETKYEQFFKVKQNNTKQNKVSSTQKDADVDNSNFFEKLHQNFSSKSHNNRLVCILSEQTRKKSPKPCSVSKPIEGATIDKNTKNNIKIDEVAEELITKSTEASGIMSRSKSSPHVSLKKGNPQKVPDKSLESMLWNNFMNSHISLQESFLPLSSERKGLHISTTLQPCPTTSRPFKKKQKRLSSHEDREFLMKTYSQCASQINSSRPSMNIPHEASISSSLLKQEKVSKKKSKLRSQTPCPTFPNISPSLSFTFSRKINPAGTNFIIKPEKPQIQGYYDPHCRPKLINESQSQTQSQEGLLSEPQNLRNNKTPGTSSEELTFNPIKMTGKSGENEVYEEDFYHFMTEYTPYVYLEGEKSNLKESIMEIYTFFSSLRIFTSLVNYIPDFDSLLGKLKRLYKNLSLSRTNEMKQFEYVYEELLNQKEDFKTLQALIFQALSNIKTLEASPKHLSKDGTPTKSTYQANEFKSIGLLNNKESIDLIRKINDLGEKVNIQKDLKEELQKKKETFKENIEELLEDKMLKMQSNSFEGLLVNFFDVILSRFESGLQEGMKNVSIFFPNLQKYTQKALYNAEFNNMKTSLKNLWTSLAGEVELSDLYKEELFGTLILTQKIIKEKLEIHSSILGIFEELANFKAKKFTNQLEDIEFYVFTKLQEILDEITGEGFSLLTSATLNVQFLDKMNIRSASFMRALSKLKTIAQMEQEYAKNVDYSEKIVLLCEERLRELEQKNFGHKIDLRTLEQAKDFANEVNNCLTRMSLCRDHFSEEQNIDFEIKADCVRRVTDSLQGLVLTISTLIKQLEKLIEVISREVVGDYTKLAEEIKKIDGAFNVYITTSIIKPGDFLAFKNPGSHLIAVSNFSKSIQKLRERLGYYQDNFGGEVTERRNSTRRADKKLIVLAEISQTKPRQKSISEEKLTNEKSNESFKRKRVIYLNPDIEIIEGIIENFQIKCQIFDQLFLFEDHFSMKNLEATFNEVSSLTFPSLLESLYFLLFELINQQTMLQVRLMAPQNEFLQGFVKETVGFQTILQKFMKACLDTANKNLQIYVECSSKLKLTTIEDYQKVGNSLKKLGKALSANLLELADKSPSLMDINHPVPTFFLKLLRSLSNKESDVFNNFGNELEKVCEYLKDSDSIILNRYGNFKKLLETIESEENIKEILINTQEKLENSRSKIMEISRIEKKYLSDPLVDMAGEACEILQGKIEEVKVIYEVQSIQDIFTIKKFKELLGFLDKDYQRNWTNLSEFEQVASEKLESLAKNKAWFEGKENRVSSTYRCWRMGMGLLENIRDFVKEAQVFHETIFLNIAQEYEKIGNEKKDLSKFFVVISESHDKTMEDMIERVRHLELKMESQSCRVMFGNFVKRVLSIEGNIFRRLSQEAQEFEKMLQNLESRFYEEGDIVKTEFLIYNFDEKAGFEIEELLFGAQKNANIIDGLLQQREISANDVFKRELELRRSRFHKFEKLLSSSLAVNKEVHLLQEKMREIFIRNLQVSRSIKEMIQDLKESVSYLERIEMKIMNDIAPLEEANSLEKYIEVQVLQATREVQEFFLKVLQNLGDLENYYANIKKEFGQKGFFLNEKFLDVIKKGKDLHQTFSCIYETNRRLSKSSSRDSRQSGRRLGVIEMDKSGKSLEDMYYEKILDVGRIMQELDKFGLNLEQEYSKLRKKILIDLHKALSLMNTKYLNFEIFGPNMTPMERKKSIFLQEIEQFIKNVKLNKITLNEFEIQLREFLQTQKDIEWSLRVLKEVEHLRRIEIVSIENFQTANQIWAEDRKLKIWLRILEVFENHIINSLEEIKNEFQNGEELRDFVGSQIKVRDGLQEVLRENCDFFYSIYNNFFMNTRKD